jgi:hypothetical protein
VLHAPPIRFGVQIFHLLIWTVDWFFVHSFMDKTYLTPLFGIFHEKFIVFSWSRNSPSFMELEGSLPCSQEPAFGPYLLLDEPSPYPQPYLGCRWRTQLHSRDVNGDYV